MRRKILRPLAWSLVGVSLSVVLLSGAIRLDQYLLRWRAYRLQSDIRSLELRKSTYADARKVINRWWDETRQPGPCQRYWCDAQISLNNLGLSLVDHRTLLSLYRRFGGRAASVRASIRVRNDIVWGKSYSVMVDSAPFYDSGNRFYLTLAGVVSSGSPNRVSPLHPEYIIGRPGGCEGCIEGYVKFTPYADPADILRLSDLNLSCLTRIHPCATQADILPTAWRELASQEGTQLDRPCTPAMVRTLSRESTRVVLGIADPRGETDEFGRLVPRFEKDLKAGDLHDESLREYPIPAPLLNVSRSFILFSRFTQMRNTQDCIAPATPENLQMARQGISEDWHDHVEPVQLPFGSINPPAIDVR